MHVPIICVKLMLLIECGPDLSDALLVEVRPNRRARPARPHERIVILVELVRVFHQVFLTSACLGRVFKRLEKLVDIVSVVFAQMGV